MGVHETDVDARRGARSGLAGDRPVGSLSRKLTGAAAADGRRPSTPYVQARRTRASFRPVTAPTACSGRTPIGWGPEKALQWAPCTPPAGCPARLTRDPVAVPFIELIMVDRDLGLGADDLGFCGTAMHYLEGNRITDGLETLRFADSLSCPMTRAWTSSLDVGKRGVRDREAKSKRDSLLYSSRDIACNRIG